jgi:hypothetical protein
MSESKEQDDFLLQFTDNEGNRLRPLDVVQLIGGEVGLVDKQIGSLLHLTNGVICHPGTIAKIYCRGDFETAELCLSLKEVSNDPLLSPSVYVKVLLIGNMRNDFGEPHLEVLLGHQIQWVKESRIRRKFDPLRHRFITTAVSNQ